MNSEGIQPPLMRAVHIDLKGMPPKPERLLKEMELYAACGYNVLLIEWEDMFPWEDPLLRSPFAYSRKNIEKIAQKAAELKLELIPLVQCLGHMENILKHAKYAPLRELGWMNSDMSPSQAGRELVSNMYSQVLRLLPDVKFFHIGGDEVAALGKGRSSGSGKAPLELYVEHTLFLTGFLGEKNIRTLIWSDMLEELPDEKIRELKERFDIVVWGGNNLEERMGRLQNLSCRIWGAPCFKGADGNTSDLPNFCAREKIISKYISCAEKFPLEGLIACGWSRYTTLASQCEPIEGALPEAVKTGLIFSGRDPEECEKLLQATHFAEDVEESRKLLENMKKLRKEAWESSVKALELSSALNLLEAYDDCKLAYYVIRMQRLLERFELLKKEFHTHFDRFFPEKAVEDYLEERILPFRRISGFLKEDQAKSGNQDALEGYVKEFHY